MITQNFILSDKTADRIKRHLLFWLFWGFYFGMVRYFSPLSFARDGGFPPFFKCVLGSLLILLPQLVLVYPVLNFVLPRYVFTGKYIKAAGLFVVFLLLALGVSAVFLIYIPWYKVHWQIDISTFSAGDKFMVAYLSVLQGGLTGTGLAVSAKMFKHYYLKNLRNEQLQRENSEVQLQILKAEIHPHFLFNTLNNIYSKAQSESSESAVMIMELSHILRFVLDEGRKKLVPLQAELQMIEDYVNLEKLRYDNKLDIHISIPEQTNNLCIAPLLLLPFIENCFKHGASKVLKKPWVTIKIGLIGDTLYMKAINGKKEMLLSGSARTGTGIENVKKRLDLIYPEKHQLEISIHEEVFVVNLSIQLTDLKSNFNT